MIILRHTVLLLLLIALGACGREPSTGEPSASEPSASEPSASEPSTGEPSAAVLPTNGCPNRPPQPPPKVVHINVNYNPHGITVAPDPACAHLGDVLQFNLHGTPQCLDKKLVTVKEKPSEPKEWPRGHGDNQLFFVFVELDLLDDLPEGVDEKDFSYDVTAECSPDLDPVVTIRKF